MAVQSAEARGRVEQLRRGVGIDPLPTGYTSISGSCTAKRVKSTSHRRARNGGRDQRPPLSRLEKTCNLYQKAGFRNKAAETWERALVLAPDDATRLSIKHHLLSLL